jgi:amino acid transporter
MTTLQPTKTLKTSKQSNEKLGAYSEAHLDSDVKQLTQPLTPATRVLPRTLSAYSGAMQNIGCNIGAGIFILQGSMIREVGSPGLVISLFVIGGIVSLFGVWSYVELGTMIPISGGAKEYITAAYPKPRGLVAFMFTHVWIWLMMPGQVGAVTVGAGMYLMNVIFGSKNFCIETGVMGGIAYEYGARGIATLCVILIVILHSFLPNAGTAMQNYMSTLKASVLLLALVVGIAAAVGMNGLEHTSNFDNIFLNSVWDPNALIQSFFKVLFIFDGWGTINYSLSELKDPVNNLPKVSFGSFSAIFFLFLGTTLSYFTVVPVADLMDENNDIIAVQFFKRTLGPLFGGKIVPFLIL